MVCDRYIHLKHGLFRSQEIHKHYQLEDNCTQHVQGLYHRKIARACMMSNRTWNARVHKMRLYKKAAELLEPDSRREAGALYGNIQKTYQVRDTSKQEAWIHLGLSRHASIIHTKHRTRINAPRHAIGKPYKLHVHGEDLLRGLPLDHGLTSHHYNSLIIVIGAVRKPSCTRYVIYFAYD